MEEYPCEDCIVKGICSQICYKLTNLTDDIAISLLLESNNVCIDCGGLEGFYKFDSLASLDHDCEYMLCSTCNSLYKSILPDRIIRRHNAVKFKTSENLDTLTTWKRVSFYDFITRTIELRGLRI
jgi:hypothetical protein